MTCSGDHTFCDPHIGVHFASADALREAATSDSPPHRLTYILEVAGNRLPAGEIVPTLLRHLGHESSSVREGALTGLYSHATRYDVRSAVRAMLNAEPSPGVRSVALDLLESTK